jgi:hypothetical protein
MADVRQRVQRVREVMLGLHLHATASEQEIHDRITTALMAAGIAHQHEVRIGKGCRVDFLCDGGVAIEVKRGKPHTGRVAAQVRRYAACPDVCAVVLVLERALIHTIAEANGKPVCVVALSRNWGIAV